jgi:hypothetical protein
MKNYKKFVISVLIFVSTLFSSCRDVNHIDKYDVNIDSLKNLPDNFYAYRGGRIFIDTNKYMIWFNLDYFGNVESVFKINDIIDFDKNQANLINKYAIDTIKSKIIAQKFIDLSHQFKFGHINIQRKNKIAFSYKDGLPEQYVITFNDSLRNVYIKNAEFKLLKNGWFENITK